VDAPHAQTGQCRRERDVRRELQQLESPVAAARLIRHVEVEALPGQADLELLRRRIQAATELLVTGDLAVRRAELVVEVDDPRVRIAGDLVAAGAGTPARAQTAKPTKIGCRFPLFAVPFQRPPARTRRASCPGNGLSSDYYVSELAGFRLWMLSWQAGHTIKVLRRILAISCAHTG